jgi:hypothetical protein
LSFRDFIIKGKARLHIIHNQALQFSGCIGLIGFSDSEYAWFEHGETVFEQGEPGDVDIKYLFTTAVKNDLIPPPKAPLKGG